MLDSLDIRKNREMIFKAGEGSGSSGSFFFFSKDNKFLIKTINKQEKDIFLSMIDSYIEHIRNNQSVLARIYGILTIKTQDFKGIHIIIMQNTSYIYSQKSFKFSFDLKGSLVNRNKNYDITKLKTKKVGNAPLFKDSNFLKL